MVGHYGHAWSSVQGVKPEIGSPWIRFINDLSVDEIKRGIAAVGNLDQPFPPNPGQFKSMCARTAEQANNDREPQKLLDEPRAKPETVAREMGKMRAILGRPNNDG
jgi:hypothetical protein